MRLPLYRRVRQKSDAPAQAGPHVVCVSITRTWVPAGRGVVPGNAGNDGCAYFFSGGTANGNAPNIALLWLCICSCICRNRFLLWSM